MKVAAAAYPPTPLTAWAEFDAKAAAWVEDAVGQGARLLVFPEYGAMELAHLDGPAAADLEAALHASARHAPRAQETWARLARAHDCYILAPTGPWSGPDRPTNRAHLHGPSGPLGHQDKQVMTRFERSWNVAPAAHAIRLFDVDGWRAAILTCYDAEFPVLAPHEADLLLVPSCTDARAGWTRVHVGARARALELQCPAIHAPTVGDAPWCPAIDENRGAAAVYGPPDIGFPEDGILAQGGHDAPGWTLATLDRAAVARVRADGHVLNRLHAAEAARAAARTCQAGDS